MTEEIQKKGRIIKPSDPYEISLDAEVRGWLRTIKGTGKVLAIIRQAINDGDQVVVRAVLNGPPVLSGLTAQDVELLHNEAGAAAGPAEQAELKVLERAEKLVDNAVAAP